MGAKVGEGAGRSDAPAHDAANLLRYFHSDKRPLWMIPRRAKNHARLQCARPAGSSNGRTPDSGSGSWGSNPCPAASEAAGRAAFHRSARLTPSVDDGEPLRLGDELVPGQLVVARVEDEPLRVFADCQIIV